MDREIDSKVLRARWVRRSTIIGVMLLVVAAAVIWGPGWSAYASIEDTGPGMSPEVQSNLFVPFFGTKRHGQGIGLTLVKEILIQHHFDFALDSRPGGPTRFSILF